MSAKSDRAGRRVFMDERVAVGLPETPADAQERIGQDVDVIAYVREDVHLAAVRSASRQSEEFIVSVSLAGMASSPDNSGAFPPLLVAVTNFGRVMRQVQYDDGEAEAGQRIDWEDVDLPRLNP